MSGLSRREPPRQGLRERPWGPRQRVCRAQGFSWAEVQSEAVAEGPAQAHPAPQTPTAAPAPHCPKWELTAPRLLLGMWGVGLSSMQPARPVREGAARPLPVGQGSVTLYRVPASRCPFSGAQFPKLELEHMFFCSALGAVTGPSDEPFCIRTRQTYVPLSLGWCPHTSGGSTGDTEAATTHWQWRRPFPGLHCE